jgi:hypothetical protein
LIKIHEKDSLEIVLTVKKSMTEVLDLTGVDIEALVKVGPSIIAGIVTFPDRPGGIAMLNFAEGTFLDQIGTHEVQARVTKGASVKTVYAEPVRVKPSV